MKFGKCVQKQNSCLNQEKKFEIMRVVFNIQRLRCIELMKIPVTVFFLYYVMNIRLLALNLLNHIPSSL